MDLDVAVFGPGCRRVVFRVCRRLLVGSLDVLLDSFDGIHVDLHLSVCSHEPESTVVESDGERERDTGQTRVDIAGSSNCQGGREERDCRTNDVGPHCQPAVVQPHVEEGPVVGVNPEHVLDHEPALIAVCTDGCHAV